MSPAIKLSSPATREFWEIPVLFEDENLLALDKPAGLPASPDRDNPNQPNLIKLLHAGTERGAAWATERRLSYLMNAHRLDAEASGVILLAKSKPVLIALADLFGSEKPVQTYIALIQGAPKENCFEVETRLAPDPVRIGLTRADARNGKRSRTTFEVLERFSGCALLKCRPWTSRTHQIRAHLRHAGLPVAGDELYGGKPLWLSQIKPNYRLKPGHEERPLISCAALHAEELQLLHPVSGEALTIHAEWPKDLKVALKYLRRFA